MVGIIMYLVLVFIVIFQGFLRPTSDPQWYKFDDDVVTKVEEKEAIQDNFGGPVVFCIFISSLILEFVIFWIKYAKS